MSMIPVDLIVMSCPYQYTLQTITDLLCILVIIILLPTVVENNCYNDRKTDYDISDACNSSTTYIPTYKLIVDQF